MSARTLTLLTLSSHCARVFRARTNHTGCSKGLESVGFQGLPARRSEMVTVAPPVESLETDDAGSVLPHSFRLENTMGPVLCGMEEALMSLTESQAAALGTIVVSLAEREQASASANNLIASIREAERANIVAAEQFNAEHHAHSEAAASSRAPASLCQLPSGDTPTLHRPRFRKRNISERVDPGSCSRDRRLHRLSKRPAVLPRVVESVE